MKTIILLALLTFGLSVNAQSIKEVEIGGTIVKSGYGNHTNRFAIANEDKDTLYVLESMYDMVTYMWENPLHKADTPTFVVVDDLSPYLEAYRKED